MDGPARFRRSTRQRPSDSVRSSTNRVRASEGAPVSAGASRRAARPRCSCDLIVRLADRPPVRTALARFSITAAGLAAAQDALHRECTAEPADWHVRLSQRGGSSQAATSELEMLLAIVRSADTHAYQLLERAGVQCAAVRHAVIDALRALGTSCLEPTSAASSDRPPRPATRLPRGGSVRAARPPRNEAGTPAARAQAERRRLAGPHVRQSSEPRSEPESVPARTLQSPVTTQTRSATQVRQAIASQQHEAEKPSRLAPPPVEPRGDSSDTCTASPADPDSQSRPTLRSIAASSLPELAGRDTPLSRLADAVGRSEARPPLVVGAPGSGRTLLACHLASVQPRPVFRLEATAYEDDAALRADLQAIANADGIAVIDDLDRVVAEVSPVCLPALTHAWSVGCPPVVTVVSPQGKGRLAAWLPGGTDGLDIVEIEPLAGEDLTRAVAGSAPAILGAHGVTLDAGAKLSELVRLADRFLAGIAMPARALDLLDLACARTVRNRATAVSRDTWLEIVVERSGLPPSRIEGDDDQRLLQLETQLQERVVGHQDALSRLADLVRRNQAGFGSHRPIASVLLLGPSGVGKTEIAKSLAEALFDRPDALVRLDMSEYSEPHAVARIVGAPPGYVGFEHGGALVDPLAARPHRVVLLDEIEKAHRDVHQLLLQVFDEGRLTDGRGRTIDFRHAVIILTSNLGAHLVDEGGEPSEDDVLAAARKAFPVELWNRIEAPLVLDPLTDEALRLVCQRLARASSARLFKERGVQYALSDDACDVLVQRAGNDRSLGARPLRHLLTRDVESMLAEAVLRGRLRAGTSVIVNASNGRLTLD